ncbi:TIGR00730 family Rossman fold protein [Novosphingobium flavum]|uniref:Cytokinin riboside 5'-monophosphate phosphoribohydrolase n=1 Tax=Novosphingobium flavum TaxID=1778672 RepID=A0A7X1KL48_9SPHN|nr:TIGR00730 family Rossman fold protein [Novosphingobium flavum]MBC2665187.1 TIGR00730 family Rossman fold protein [Novosphingobium flavum]
MTATPARTLRTIAIFCGSNVGEGEAYKEAAAELGGALARRGIGIVYGGTHKGLMGILADAALAGGGKVHGVITRRLHEKGHLHPTLSASEIADGMRARKERMLDLADACIALPGGIGTAEEFMEAWTLNQLGDVDKPVGLLNVDGYYDAFMGFIDTMIARKFLPPAHREGIALDPDADALIDKLAVFEKPSVAKWM